MKIQNIFIFSETRMVESVLKMKNSAFHEFLDAANISK